MGNKMLVVVDYQNDFVDGALGFHGAEKLDTGIAAKVQEFLDHSDLIVVTKDTHGNDYLNTREGRSLPVPHCIEGTPGHELYGKTGELIESSRPNPKMYVIDKTTFGACAEELWALPRGYNAPDTIEFVGLVTNMCVLANVCCFQAMYPNAQIIVHADLCASFDKELHNKTLDVLRGMQVEVQEG